jgi:ferredoxin-NADP reductase
VFVAGGNGIAPLRAVLRHAIYAHASKLVLLYSARSPEAFAFQSELEALQRTAQLTLYQTVTRSGADCWHGARGRLRTSDLVELGGDSAATWLVSGPAAFVVSVMGMLGDIGVAPEKIRFERGIEAPPAAVRCAR